VIVVEVHNGPHKFIYEGDIDLVNDGTYIRVTARCLFQYPGDMMMTSTKVWDLFWVEDVKCIRSADSIDHAINIG
jgi:hypothetical protein